MELYSCCERSNRNGKEQAKALGYAVSGALGYSHLTGGYSGGQAEYVRIPFADFGAFIVPDGYSDEQVLFLSDIFPTGYMAAENCDIKKARQLPSSAAVRSDSFQLCQLWCSERAESSPLTL
jgi:threonine dehydrogenase-like Zn-dependent dehydrogenase